MFIGRNDELEKLSRSFNSGKFELAVIYGRRRIGKTTLINEFLKNKKSIYFTAFETSSSENLKYLSQSFFLANPQSGLFLENATYLGDSTPLFPDYQSLLDAVYVKAKSQRIVFVIDEYPYLAASYPAISSLLQIQIDTKFQNSQLFLILCGSSMSFMENQVLGYQSPLFGRRTAQFKIEPLSYFESRKFFKNYSDEDSALIYGFIGGTPLYLEKINPELSVENNLKQALLNPAAYLFEEPANLLKQELRDPANYNAIISAVASGCSTVSKIANKTGLSTSICSTYLKNLIELKIVKKMTSMFSKSSKKTVYSIKDHLFRSWYRFVLPNLSLIQNNLSEIAFQRIEPGFNQYMGPVFEEICEQWLWKQNGTGELPFTFTKLGRWWGTDPVAKEAVDIDLIAADDNEKVMYCECKWKKEKIDLGVLKTLQARSHLIPADEKFFYLFSRSGFTKAVEDEAKMDENIKLVSFGQMRLD